MDTEINVPSAKNPELSKISPLKLGLSQNIAVHSLSAARNVAFFPLFFRLAFLIYSVLGFQIVCGHSVANCDMKISGLFFFFLLVCL